MATLHAIYLYLAAHYIADAGIALLVIATICNRVFPDGKLPTAIAVIIDLLSLLAKPGQTGVYKAMSFPGVPSRRKIAPTPPPPAAAALVLFLVGITALSGCLPPPSACLPPVSSALQAKCNFENNLIACGETTGFDLVPIIADVVMSAIGGTFSSATLVAELESEGYSKAAPCILAAVEGYLMPVAPQIAAKVHEALAFKLAKDGKHGIIDIKLKNGYVVHVVLK